MKLLFDQNISHKLVAALQNTYPGSQHVSEVGMSAASDDVVWKYALENGFIIVSKVRTFTIEVCCWAILQRLYGSGWATAQQGRSANFYECDRQMLPPLTRMQTAHS
jgi:hypothetical protein